MKTKPLPGPTQALLDMHCAAEREAIQAAVAALSRLTRDQRRVAIEALAEPGKLDRHMDQYRRDLGRNLALGQAA